MYTPEHLATLTSATLANLIAMEIVTGDLAAVAATIIVARGDLAAILGDA